MNYEEQATRLLQEGFTAQQLFFKEVDHSFLDEMIAHIGHERSEVRDYVNLRLLIEGNTYGVFSVEQKQYMIEQILQKKLLLYRIHEEDETSVFTRSLAAEWLRILIETDIHIVTKTQLDDMLQQSIALLQGEHDLRSYTEQGLAYAIVNASNLIRTLVQHDEFSLHYAPKILFAIQANFWKDIVFIDDEEEKLLSVVGRLMQVGLEETLVIEWIEQAFDKLNTVQQIEGYSPIFLHSRTVLLNVMKSFYFNLKFSNSSKKLQSVISQFIQQWNHI